MKKSSYNIRALIIILLLAMTTAMYFLPLPDEYRINLVTEFIGVLVTVVLVDYLYRLESKKEERKHEERRLINLDSILSVYISRYIESSNVLTSDKFIKDRDLTRIHISDLQYIYDQAFLTSKPFFVKKYVLYFESLEKLTEVIKYNIPSIDAKHHQGMVYLLQAFAMANDVNHLKTMVEERTQMNYGKEPAWKKDIETLKGFAGKMLEEGKGYSTRDLYVQLLKSIDVNMNIINSYNHYMGELLKKHGIKKENKEIET